MATARDKKDWQALRQRRRKGRSPNLNKVGGVNKQTKAEIVHEAEKLVIKPGMKPVWDDELNKVVWK